MNNTYNISLRSIQNENNDENTISNESISENKRSKIVKISTLYKELDYILNKFSGQNNENEENESPSKKNSFSNNILVSSNQEKISLNKEQFLNYERQIKRLDLISVLSYENFSQFFNFLPPRTSEIKSFYGIDFKDQTLKNSDLSIFSQIHSPLALFTKQTNSLLACSWNPLFFYVLSTMSSFIWKSLESSLNFH